MRTRPVLLAAALLAGAVAVPSANSAPAAPVIAVLDTGARPTHQEFDYRGARSSSDQFVGWWDFTTERKGEVVLPEPGQRWDTAVPDPYDENGHGTATAATAAGRRAASLQTVSGAPGAKLAIAKVGNGDGTIEGDLAAAVDWAVQTVRADVVSISIGSIVPVPASLQADVYDAIERARAAGVLVVVSNGNGYANAGIPGAPAWASWYASSTDVLAVGAAGTSGYSTHTDPEVVAPFTVGTASHEGDRDYVTIRGTSFSAPYVAGSAARLIAAARAAGRPAGADRLEALLKRTATATAAPPSVEGYGEVTPASVEAALGHARAGTDPQRPSPDLDALYVESGSGTLRAVWSDVLR